MIETTVKVDGMMCGMCEAHVSDAIRGALPVKKVTASHTKGQAVILSEAPLDEEDLRAAIGAAIGPCCFETDADVPQALEAALGAEAEPYITRRGPKWHVDLKGVNARWLEKAGVRQIDVSPDCTACHPELYWSHRRMGQARGAQIAMICL